MDMIWLKRYFPRGLYGRAALILLLPIVVLQIVVSVVFIQRQYEGVTVQMSNTVAREIQLVLASLEARPGTIDEIIEPLEMELTRVPAEAFEQPNVRDWSDLTGRVIVRNLSEQIPTIRRFDFSQNGRVSVFSESAIGPVMITFDRNRISARNPHQLLVYLGVFSVLVTVIAFIYLRNQLRPIRRLARAAEAFGRGRHMPYSPAGATEVRAAGAAFVDMRTRIERQIETRTLMLSGVSHDLRTPLTRMRLSMSLMDDDAREMIAPDVEDMQAMIDAFLDFVKGSSDGASEKTDPVKLAQDVVESARRSGHPVTLTEASGDGVVFLQAVPMRRALNNLINNAARYGSRVEVSVALSEKSLRFRVEDDGPGIPAEQRADAQRPFTQLDPARNQNRGGGVGLGLAIAADIARGHGGTLRLGHSEKLGGLRADIVIAR